MYLIDSHTHVYDECFEEDFSEMLTRARENNVKHMVLPCVEWESYEPMKKLLEAYPNDFSLAMGLHPTSVKEDYRSVLAKMRELLDKQSFVAVGEVGLDYYWDRTYEQEQRDAFKEQLLWCRDLNLPVIIHTRSAFEDTFKVLDECSSYNIKGVFHSFTGTEEELEQVLTYENFYVGLNGVVTFKNSSLKDYVKRIPLERLVLETDAPYLSPAPKRGKRNEPAHLIYTLNFLSDLWKLPPETLAQQTSANAQRLFSLSLG